MSDFHAKYNEVEKLIDDEKFEDAIAGLEQNRRSRTNRSCLPIWPGTGLYQDWPTRFGDPHAEKACELEPNDPSISLP